MIKVYNDIDDFLHRLKLGVEKKIDGFVIYSYDEVSENALITQSTFKQQFFELSLEINSGCSFQIDDFKFPLSEKRLSIIAPYRLQSNFAHKNLTEESKGFTMFFKPDFLGADLSQRKFFLEFNYLDPKQSPAFQLNNKQLKELTMLFQLLRYEQNEYGKSSITLIKNLVRAVLEKAKSYQNANIQNVSYNPLVSEFHNLCITHFLKLHTVKEFAQKLSVTPKHLTETVKKETGISALQTIHSAKIQYAKGLLSQTNFSIKEIAFELGFDNPEYFNVFFKRIEGKTPSQFRQI